MFSRPGIGEQKPSSDRWHSRPWDEDAGCDDLDEILERFAIGGLTGMCLMYHAAVYNHIAKGVRVTRDTQWHKKQHSACMKK